MVSISNLLDLKAVFFLFAHTASQGLESAPDLTRGGAPDHVLRPSSSILSSVMPSLDSQPCLPLLDNWPLPSWRH